MTNLFTGGPARAIVNRLMREICPLSAAAPAFPTAGGALTPLRGTSEVAGKSDFSGMWAGQAAALVHEMSTVALTRHLVEADDHVSLASAVRKG